MKKLFTNMFLLLTLLAMTTGTAHAQEITTLTGTVQTVILETSATNETIVVVTLVDETTGVTQTVNISLESAVSLGLITTDPATGASTVVTDAVGTTVVIDTTTVIPEDVEENTSEDQHPVGSALSDFFGNVLGVDYETIMSYHDDGVGFGVIAQALWLTNELDGDTAAFEALLQAKQSGDYSSITLADGSTPDNWGDVVKSLKKGDNLGSIMSGKGESAQDATDATDKDHGNSNDRDSLNDNENGNSKGNNTEKEDAKDKDNKNKDKNKDKDKGNKGKDGNGNGKGGGRP